MGDPRFHGLPFRSAFLYICPNRMPVIHLSSKLNKCIQKAGMIMPQANTADLLNGTDPARAEQTALADRRSEITYASLDALLAKIADEFASLGFVPGDRVAAIVDKRIEIVAAMFACFRAGLVLVPINPQLKQRQIRHILDDSGARLLLGAENRGQILAGFEADEIMIATVSADGNLSPLQGAATLPPWRSPAAGFEGVDLAALFYTSGSTGLPKAVATTHANIIAGAESVKSYIGNNADDVILAILPLSFDAGFSQLTTGFLSGASIVLQDYLLPNDISRACARHGVTGITGVPAIWTATLAAKWEEAARKRIRYFANTGGHLPYERILQLMELFPNARPFPMYGLTEAFRSAYLPPEMVHVKKGSMGRAIPGATLCVVDENGEECSPGVPGELVHAGPTVAAGYWNNPEETGLRFRSAPAALRRRGISGTVVFSGDLVEADEEGYLYYKGRGDAQIKISGHRISFAEIEDVALTHPAVRACVAAGHKRDQAPDPVLVLFVEGEGEDLREELEALLRAELPSYTVPSEIVLCERLIVNNNGKYDARRMIAEHFEKG